MVIYIGMFHTWYIYVLGPEYGHGLLRCAHAELGYRSVTCTEQQTPQRIRFIHAINFHNSSIRWHTIQPPTSIIPCTILYKYAKIIKWNTRTVEARYNESASGDAIERQLAGMKRSSTSIGLRWAEKITSSFVRELAPLHISFQTSFAPAGSSMNLKFPIARCQHQKSRRSFIHKSSQSQRAILATSGDTLRQCPRRREPEHRQLTISGAQQGPKSSIRKSHVCVKASPALHFSFGFLRNKISFITAGIRLQANPSSRG